jgi:hypothetical protein
MEECPVCLEVLSGTVVHLGCCKKHIHIQCYVPKCPFCRAELPVPIHAVQPQHVIVPIPVTPIPSRWSLFIRILSMTTLVTGTVVFVLSPYIKV